jgi:hypothetical protein
MLKEENKKMLKPSEVFENEESEKLLNYFVAYKKLNPQLTTSDVQRK